MNWRNWKDEDLSRVYEETYRKPAFSNTPRWKKIALWIVCLLFPVLGITAILQMIARAPIMLGVMVALGAIGAVALFFVLKAEQEFRQDQRSLTLELERRGLYEQTFVRSVAPWEDTTRP